jgi:predicted nucleic acid-binding protein
MAGYVLDTSAILAYLRDEVGAGLVEGVLEQSSKVTRSDTKPVLVPFIAMMEVEYQTRRQRATVDVDFLLASVEQWPVDIRESDRVWRRQAALLKTAGRLSLADAWIAALALMEDAELVHKDPEFDRVPGLKVLRLPYRQRRA